MLWIQRDKGVCDIMGGIEYIQPNQIGYMEISKKERKIIVKAEKKYVKTLIFIGIVSVALIVCICLIINSIFFLHYFNLEHLKPVILLSFIIWVNVCTIYNVKYTGYHSQTLSCGYTTYQRFHP